MIFYSPYTLQRKVLANSQSQSFEQKGALIKIVDQDLNFGVADLCPWPELGDLTWQQEIQQQGPLFQRAIQLAQKDLLARKNKVSVKLPAVFQNHQTLHPGSVSASQNLKIVKIKGTKNIFQVIQQIKSVAHSLVRLDFNFCLTVDEFKNFLNGLSPEELKKIEAIEDPFPFDLKLWTELGKTVKLVLDFNPQGYQWPFCVCKPTRTPVLSSFEYMTSSMDHPIGLAHGLWIAADYKDRTHGFLTLDMYHQTPFHKGFEQTATTMAFNSTGYGLGFDEELNKLNWIPWIDWSNKIDSFILFNPRSTDKEKTDLSEIYRHAQNTFSKKDLILIPSSGSSKQADESVKVFVHTKRTLIKAAERVNAFFKINSTDKWGSLLPAYHVGGLSIYIRAYLTQSEVFGTDWNSFNIEWLVENKITVISMVPTQVYDLVQRQWSCPAHVKFVFVGGAALADDLLKQAKTLGWPIVKTYGMTETGSMIAVSEHEGADYQLLPEVIVQSDHTTATVHTPSLALGVLQKKNQQISVDTFEKGYVLPDQVEVIDQKIRFLGRSQNQIKILGEGVSLDQLRSLWERLDRQSVILNIPDERAENKLVLVSVKPVSGELIIQFNQQVKPYERLKWEVIVSYIPRSDLGKVLYAELQHQIEMSTIKSISNFI